MDKPSLTDLRRNLARRVYHHRLHVGTRLEALADRVMPEQDAVQAPLTFDVAKHDFVELLMDFKVHDCPMCNRGGKLVEERLGPLVAMELRSLLRIREGNGALSDRIVSNHLRANGWVNEQALFLVSDTDSEKAIVSRLKTLALFGLVERKRKGWIEITKEGELFAKGEIAVRFRCFLYGGKPLAMAPDTIGIADLDLTPFGQEPIVKTDDALVPERDEVHTVTAGSEE